MQPNAATCPEPELKHTGELFAKEKGDIALEKAAAVKKSVLLDQEFASPGVVFEPLKGRKISFLYGSYQWSEGEDNEVVVMFSTHRVILRGKRLGSLPDEFSGQKVRRVTALARADMMLAEAAELNHPIVTEIKIDRLNDDGKVE